VSKPGSKSADRKFEAFWTELWGTRDPDNYTLGLERARERESNKLREKEGGRDKSRKIAITIEREHEERGRPALGLRPGWAAGSADLPDPLPGAAQRRFLTGT
jgi:hypothetical protein